MIANGNAIGAHCADVLMCVRVGIQLSGREPTALCVPHPQLCAALKSACALWRECGVTTQSPISHALEDSADVARRRGGGHERRLVMHAPGAAQDTRHADAREGPGAAWRRSLS